MSISVPSLQQPQGAADKRMQPLSCKLDASPGCRCHSMMHSWIPRSCTTASAHLKPTLLPADMLLAAEARLYPSLWLPRHIGRVPPVLE